VPLLHVSLVQLLGLRHADVEKPGINGSVPLPVPYGDGIFFHGIVDKVHTPHELIVEGIYTVLGDSHVAIFLLAVLLTGAHGFSPISVTSHAHWLIVLPDDYSVGGGVHSLAVTPLEILLRLLLGV
jgi:hypothetical protein